MGLHKLLCVLLRAFRTFINVSSGQELLNIEFVFTDRGKSPVKNKLIFKHQAQLFKFLCGENYALNLGGNKK
jgi:hypothetical protein